MTDKSEEKKKNNGKKKDKLMNKFMINEQN